MTREQAIDLVHGLVAIPSLSRQEGPAAAWLAARMSETGYDRAFVDDAGNAVGELGPADAATVLVLLGHIDTVPGTIPVRIAPVEVQPPRSPESLLAGAPASSALDPRPPALALYGRGSVDAKGPLATFAAAGARLGSAWAHDAGVRLVVVGAVEEEAATSKGARFIASRFDGVREPRPAACVIGEPSSWRRVTLGYKGRLLMDVEARQAMAHTAGPDASVAEVVVGLWNWVRNHADAVNAGRARPFDQLSPSLRRFITANTGGMTDTVDAQIAWRLPVGFDAGAFVNDLLAWTTAHLESPGTAPTTTLATGEGGRHTITISGPRSTISFTFRGWEHPWHGERSNALVRSFLAAIRQVEPSAQPGFVVKTGTSDMNVVAPVWQCPIVAYGPGDSALDHTPTEHLLLDEYWTAVCVLERTLREFARSLP
jgi:[amino group carrier protein]-lysine/ornithine hydrolase